MLFIAFLPARAPKARAFFCRQCGARVCTDGHSIVVNGHPVRATYTNPAGEACEIITFREAENLRGADFSTEECSWFEGYSWRPVACAKCRQHVGWAYEAVEPNLDPKVFYGLLTSALRSEPDRGRDM